MRANPQVDEPLGVYRDVLVALFSSRDRPRGQPRATIPRGIPLLTEAGAALADYLAAERRLGRSGPCGHQALAFTLIGTGDMLFAGELDVPPTAVPLPRRSDPPRRGTGVDH